MVGAVAVVNATGREGAAGHTIKGRQGTVRKAWRRCWAAAAAAPSQPQEVCAAPRQACHLLAQGSHLLSQLCIPLQHGRHHLPHRLLLGLRGRQAGEGRQGRREGGHALVAVRAVEQAEQL